jgi:glutamate---methylamine ligase
VATELTDFAKERGIKYFLISFTDLFGVQRSKLVPAHAMGDMQKDGAGFAGFATWLDMTPANSDMFAMPDPASVLQLPWKKEVAWVAADLMMDNEIVEQAPRRVLKRLLEQSAKRGYKLMSGVEPEYHLIAADGRSISDPGDRQDKPCYDQQALMRRYDVIAEICDSMTELGWGPYQNDHEDANGQFEMNWNFSDALTTADRHAFFKYMVKTIAEKHGLRATFMPKPFMNLTGNGCHMHASLWTADGRTNLFANPKGELGLSTVAYYFVAGVLHNGEALSAITNPTVNSYKRINAPRTTSGATWSPNTLTYGGNNRTNMVRIPGPGRVEFRLADGAVNPYLHHAVYLAAGIDGIDNKRDPGERMDIDMYTEGWKATNAKKLPLNLLDALRAFEASALMRELLGGPFCDAYVKLKTADWNSYASHLTDWERERTLDC